MTHVFHARIRGWISGADQGVHFSGGSRISGKGVLTLNISHFQGKREKRNEMDFLHNITTLLSLFMNKNDVTHLMNQNLSLHLYILQTNDFSD